MKWISIISIIFSFNCFAQNTQSVKIYLTDTQTGLPIENATVSISKFHLTSTTNQYGTARFDQVPLGRFELEVSSVTYGKHIYKELILENAHQLILNFQLQPENNELNEVTVNPKSPTTSALTNVETITQEQILRFPATFFDPARLIMSYAGVANANDQANNISVRGNLPDFVQWRLEGVEIVNPNHTNNAGTFSDKPTAVGGGTNILSAQMLGNMNFLSGAFPAGYANAIGGVFDMNMRAGNNEKYQHVFQAGLVGLDLSSEGPINRKKGSSYLINYRYSFTGLLALAGVNFGGETIKFQDLAFTFNFPTKKAGTFTFFGMGGTSSNLFVPEADSTKWETSKQFNNIDFYSRMGLLGAKHSIKLFKKWHLKTVLANSGLENLRNAYTGNLNVDYDYSAKDYLSFSTVLSGNLNKLWSLNTGVNLNYQYNKFNYINTDIFFYSFANLIIQPHVRISNREKSRLNYNLGFVAPYYSYSQSQYFEPRLSASYLLNTKHQLLAAYGLHSQVTNSRIAFYLPYKPSRAHHFTLGYQYDIDQKQNLSVEVFYQSLFNLIKFDSVYVSTLNGYEVGDFSKGYYQLNQHDQGRNYGVEISYKRYLENGFFGHANATFYKSKFRAFDHKFYDTRYSGDYIYNLTIGKEWERTNGKIWGLNARTNWLGGFRDYKIELDEESGAYFDFNRPLVVKYDDYFRIDTRAYLKKTTKRGSEMISLDLQNLTGRKNVAYNYFDTLNQKVMQQLQMGLVPMLNYRWEF